MNSRHDVAVDVLERGVETDEPGLEDDSLSKLASNLFWK